MLDKGVGSSDVLQSSKSDLSNNGAELSRGSGDSVRGRSVSSAIGQKRERGQPSFGDAFPP